MALVLDIHCSRRRVIILSARPLLRSFLRIAASSNTAVNGIAIPRRLWLCSKAARYLQRQSADNTPSPITTRLGGPMKRVTGIGGIFFKAKDAPALQADRKSTRLNSSH